MEIAIGPGITVRMYSVESSIVHRVGFIRESPKSSIGHLCVEYRFGSVYAYCGVSLGEYVDLLNSKSIGRYMHDSIIVSHKETKLTP